MGMYAERLGQYGGQVIGLEYDFERALEAHGRAALIVYAAGEGLPFPDGSFDLILSHEVLEHVADDRQAVDEMSRLLRPGGRLVLFVPNRGYPFETHGIYWRGRYHFGNIPLVNYLPRAWRDRLAPHVRVYSRSDLERLFAGLPLRVVEKTGDLRGLRQHHRPLPEAGRVPARRAASAGEDAAERVGAVAFLGGEKL